MKQLKNEDDLTLLKEIELHFAWYIMSKFALELFIAWFFYCVNIYLFWIYISIWVVYIFFPNNSSKKHFAIKKELIARGLWK